MSTRAKRAARAACVVAGVVLLALPLVLALVFNLEDRRFPGDIGRMSGAVILMVLVYVVWMPLVVYGLLWVLDRFDVHYTPRERRPMATPRQRRRTWAGLRFLSRRPTLGQGPAARTEAGGAPGERGPSQTKKPPGESPRAPSPPKKRPSSSGKR